MSIVKPAVWMLLLPALLGGEWRAARAQDGAAAEAPGSQETAAAEPLADSQKQLADKYRRLEDLIFKMADFEATSNPRRAALLRQAYKQSKDRLTQSQLNTIVALLEQRQYKRALDGQEVARQDLQGLLQLLLSEDRSDRLKTETQRLEDAIKELKRLERLQRGMRGQTERAADPRDLEAKQEALADRTGELAQQLADTEPPTAEESAPREADPSSRDESPESDAAEPSDAREPGDSSEPGDSRESADAGEPSDTGEPQPGEGQTPPEGQAPGSETQDAPPADPSAPAEAAQGAAESPPSPPAGDQPSPAQQRVREAEQRMREAQQRLADAQRSESLEKQTAALEKLQEAIAELEEVLRQLREEEKARVLTLLESRFRQMLEEQLRVYEATQRLDATPEDQRGRALDIRANKLAFDQRKIAGQADRCLNLLREEGSSLAFPEVVEQIRDDMETVSDRLAESQVGSVTQGLQQDIITSLEEMIAAFQKAQQDMDQAPPAEPGEPGETGDPPLVDALAELKMIRSLQWRVNLRTQRYSGLLEHADDPVGQATTDELRQALVELGQRQARIQQITRDIVLGKNR